MVDMKKSILGHVRAHQTHRSGSIWESFVSEEERHRIGLCNEKSAKEGCHQQKSGGNTVYNSFLYPKALNHCSDCYFT